MNTIRVNRTSANTCDLLVNGTVLRQYWAPPGGGYVRSVTDRKPANLGQQVGYDLAGSGDMMHAPADTDLTTMIRAAVKTKAGRENVLMQAGIF
jgi:hypothetical protein